MLWGRYSHHSYLTNDIAAKSVLETEFKFSQLTPEYTPHHYVVLLLQGGLGWVPVSDSCRLPPHELGDLEAANHWGQIGWVLVVTGYGPQAPHGGLSMGRDTLVLPSDLLLLRGTA